MSQMELVAASQRSGRTCHNGNFYRPATWTAQILTRASIRWGGHILKVQGYRVAYSVARPVARWRQLKETATRNVNPTKSDTELIL
jgi:hypothetical protein